MKKLLDREPAPEMVEAAIAAWHKTHALMSAGDYTKEMLIAAHDAAPALPEPGEVERNVREIARTLDDDEELIQAADLIAAMKADNSRLAQAAIVKDRPEPGEVEQRLREAHERGQYISIGNRTLEGDAADLIAALITTKEVLAKAYRSAHERAEKAEAELQTAQNWCAIHKANAEKAEARVAELEDVQSEACKALTAEVIRLRAENEQLREDAERWRYIREQTWFQIKVTAYDDALGTIPEHADAAIDAVIDAAKEKP